MTSPYRLHSVEISGYRPFADFRAQFGDLDVFVGANGSGKSSVFEFLRFLRDALNEEIPPGIVPGYVGQEVFHIGGEQEFRWMLRMRQDNKPWLEYGGRLRGPVGTPRIVWEQADYEGSPSDTLHFAVETADNALLFVEDGEGFAQKRVQDNVGLAQHITLPRATRLGLGAIFSPQFDALYALREYILNWRFYSALRLANEKMRRSVPVQQEPQLAEDGGNLSAVLFYLMTEHGAVFDELQHHLRGVVPGFRGLTVKARGGPGEVMAFWREGGVDQELSLADVSDGALRLLCWLTLALTPTPPTLICIDEPDQGVHPRALPVLAGLFDKASVRTQLLLATHNSYFLTQFALEQIGVFRKEQGGAVFARPADSKILTGMLADFGADEVEQLHRSDELERFA